MDRYYTPKNTGSSKYVEKMSRFLAFAIPIDTQEEARDIIREYTNEYHDARHVCWAYMIGPERTDWQLNDNGEPSGTAGKPILGQINSAGLTNVLVIVVRYFGGIKLGTSGLISAYREAARLALAEGGKKECRQTEVLEYKFSYAAADAVMKVVKSTEMEIIEKTFDNVCSITFACPLDMKDEVVGKLGKIEGAWTP